MLQMTLEEKIGQMEQLNEIGIKEESLEKVRKGLIGSVLNEKNSDIINKIQKIAIEESRLGIPIIFARDVIHGFKTIFPIPLGQAASWNPQVLENGGRVAAIEATSVGIRWTFAPMIDISRDARWGRIAESLGEDPYLSSVLGTAMIKGFQGKNLNDASSMAACAKHFVGYGAAEGGRDYNTTIISEEQLRNTYLPPFKAVLDVGCATIMTSFNEINGIPSSGNPYLTKQILRKEWGFDGVVVSDWASIKEMINHGYCIDGSETAEKAANAGIDIDMMGHAYTPYLGNLIKEGKIKLEVIDNAVRNILRLKFRLGLFDNPYVDTKKPSPFFAKEHLEMAKDAAAQSLVLLKNEKELLPLDKNIKSIAVIGPMADAIYEQMGTWVMDGDKNKVVTPLAALRSEYGKNIKINYVQGLKYSRDKNTDEFSTALEAAKASDVILYFAGEEAMFTGEAHSRADISLPGAQKELLRELSKAGKPIVLIMLAGRPIEIFRELPFVDAFLYAWHPGNMGGPAITDVLFGKIVPSGRLPITYPLMVGQLPIYYNHKNTGRPPKGELQTIENIAIGKLQTSLGNTSYYLDAGHKPLYPFGYGLTYTTFEYSGLELSSNVMKPSERLTACCNVKNTGKREAVEIVQLYVRDITASVTRPVKELKDFKRITLKPGETQKVTFELITEQLKFWNNEREYLLESGDFNVWIGKNSDTGLLGEFKVIK
ncbi:MAG TPA: beta-glucosidase BglX [Paludibacter sp.]